MTLPVFNPPMTPSIGATNKPEVKVQKAEFGDGYTQATRDGINNIRAVFDLSWDALTPDEAERIIGFFEARGGVDPFTYSIPATRLDGRWTCETWTHKDISGGFLTVTATLRQSFNLDA